MTDKLNENVLSYLEGTCNSIEAAIERFDLDASVEEIESYTLDNNLECCPGCGWWMESHELIDEDDNVVGCDQCRTPSDPD